MRKYRTCRRASFSGSRRSTVRRLAITRLVKVQHLYEERPSRPQDLELIKMLYQEIKRIEEDSKKAFGMVNYYKL